MKPVKIRGIVCATPEQVLDVYQPTKKLRPLWVKHGAFIKRCVWMTKPVSPVTTKNMLSAATLYVASCRQLGYEIDAETIFTPDRVDHYIGKLMPGISAENRATRRSMFKKIGLANTKEAPWVPPRATLPKRTRASRYTDREIAALEKAARNQSTERQRQGLLALFYLCLGAGARPGEVAHIRPEHVHIHGRRVRVDIPGKNARTVPVHIDVAPQLIDFMASITTPYVMGNFDPSHRDPVGLHKSHTVMPDWAPSSMNAARLRTTWLVRLLNSNARLSEIAAAAGVKQLYAIEALMPWVDVRDDADLYLAGEK